MDGLRGKPNCVVGLGQSFHQNNRHDLDLYENCISVDTHNKSNNMAEPIVIVDSDEETASSSNSNKQPGEPEDTSEQGIFCNFYMRFAVFVQFCNCWHLLYLSADQMECPICLQTCIHPARLPCGHIFCFLCVKVRLRLMYCTYLRGFRQGWPLCYYFNLLFPDEI